MEPEHSYLSVIKNPGFLNLWINQILVQLSYNSLNFALLIWVFHLTHSNLAVSLLLIASYLPALFFALFAGVIVDVTDRRNILLFIDALMAMLFLSLLLGKNSFGAILIVAFLVNTSAQLYNPAEASAIPLIVKKSQLFVANSLFSTTLYASFLLGFGLAGPLIDQFGINFIFLGGGGLLTFAAFLALFFPSIVNKSDIQAQKLAVAIKMYDWQEIKRLGVHEIRQTLDLVRGKLSLLIAIFLLAATQTVVAILTVLIPSFFETALHIQATNASYVLIVPLGIGMILGAFLVSHISKIWPKRIIIGRAIVGSGLLLFLAGVSPVLSLVISPVIHHFPIHHPLPFTYQLPTSSVLAGGAFLLGMVVVSVVITAQTALQENSPEEDRGKVFALLGATISALTIVPVFFTGILDDILGPQSLFLLIGGIITIVGWFALNPAFFFAEHHLPFRFREFMGLGHWER